MTDTTAAAKAMERLVSELSDAGMPLCAKSVSRPDPDAMAILPSIALRALTKLATENEELRRERDELKAAKWDVRHADTINDMVAIGMARDDAEARALASEQRVKALEARIAAAVKVIEYGYDRMGMMKRTTTMACEHGRPEHEDCIGCYDEALMATLTRTDDAG